MSGVLLKEGDGLTASMFSCASWTSRLALTELCENWPEVLECQMPLSAAEFKFQSGMT